MISTVVLTCPQRLKMGERLAAELGVQLHCGQGQGDHAADWLTALTLARAGGGSHVLVLEDDAVPCRDLLAGVTAAIAARPLSIISYFCGRVEMNRTRGHWVEIDPDGPLLAVALSLPRPVVSSFLRWAARRSRLPEMTRRNGDHLLAWWLHETRRTVWATKPSLVQHGGPGAAESTLGHDHELCTIVGDTHMHVPVASMTSRHWIGDGDPTAIDWT